MVLVEMDELDLNISLPTKGTHGKILNKYMYIPGL